MDWILKLDFWLKLVLIAFIVVVTGLTYYVMLLIIKRGIRYKNIQIGIGEKYLTAAETINLIMKNNTALREKFNILFKKRMSDQMIFAEQKTDCVKELMMTHYTAYIKEKKLFPLEEERLKKEYLKTTILLLHEQLNLCRDYFSEISGSIKEATEEELNDKKSDINERIHNQVDWMIKKATRTITEWFVETKDVSREEIFNMNMTFINDIKHNISEALKAGHRIHNEYNEKIKKIDHDLQAYVDKLLNGDKEKENDR